MGAKTPPKIEIVGEPRAHAKASERYVDVVFRYPDEGGAEWRGSVPIEYRRTGVHAESPEEIDATVASAYEAMRPSKKTAWLAEQERFWSEEKSGAGVTRAFFDALLDSTWKCQTCSLPSNPNFARRIQDIKECGYTLATERRVCLSCDKTTSHLQLLRLPRAAETGYEAISPVLRKRILKELGSKDAFEGMVRTHLLPDHKFPEIRWDEETPEENSDDMRPNKIRAKFQLLNNQRNQQKREACRACFQTSKRGYPFGIKYYYKGGEGWPADLPAKGRKAEQGCIGCGWYDLDAWRASLNARVAKTPS